MCGVTSLPVSGVFEDVTCVWSNHFLSVSGVFEDVIVCGVTSCLCLQCLRM